MGGEESPKKKRTSPCRRVGEGVTMSTEKRALSWETKRKKGLGVEVMYMELRGEGREPGRPVVQVERSHSRMGEGTSCGKKKAGWASSLR